MQLIATGKGLTLNNVGLEHMQGNVKKMVGARGFEPPTFPRPAIAACSGRSKQSENIG
jgi:hypothetical protein